MHADTNMNEGGGCRQCDKLENELEQAQLVNTRLRLSWREDTAAEKGRADAHLATLKELERRLAVSESKLVSLTADRDQWKGRADQLQEERDSYASRLEEARKLLDEWVSYDNIEGAPNEATWKFLESSVVERQEILK